MNLEMITIFLAIFLGIVVFVYYYLIKKNEKQEISKFTYTVKQDEDILHDSPTSIDKIGFMDYAKVLTNHIKSNSSFSVYGIYGPWGSGKTSLMKMIKSELKDDITVFFDAWKFKGKISIFDALCQIIGEKLGEELHSTAFEKKLRLYNTKNRYEQVKYSVRKINKFNENMEVIVNYLNTNKKSKIVIFVDDLDRCNPSDAVDFLESLKVFFDISKINFVIGVNYEILYYEINKRYKDIAIKNNNFTEEYLAKMVNVPFYIPSLDDKQIQNFIEKNIEINEVKEAADIFAIGLEGNLRTIKRFVNSYVVLWNVSILRGIKINARLLAKILIIQVRYKDIYKMILLEPEYLLTLQDIIFKENNPKYRRRYEISDKEINRIPIDLKKLLKIEPYFNDTHLNTYINLSQDDNNNEKQFTENHIDEYLLKLQNAKIEEIPDLRIFPVSIRANSINIIKESFNFYTDIQKKYALQLLSKVWNDEIAVYIKNILNNDNDINLNIKLTIIFLLNDKGEDIQNFIWDIFNDFYLFSLEDQQNIIELIIKLIKKGNGFCIDVIEKLSDKISWNNYDAKLKVNLLQALGESKDRKAIDIIFKNFISNDVSILQVAFNAIASLDVNSLDEWYNIYINNIDYRGAFIEAIEKKANKGDSIIKNINISEIISILKSEHNESNQISEIRLLKLIASSKLDEISIFNDDKDVIIDESIQLLDHIARYDEKWLVRAEAEKAKTVLIEQKTTNFSMF